MRSGEITPGPENSKSGSHGSTKTYELSPKSVVNSLSVGLASSGSDGRLPIEPRRGEGGSLRLLRVSVHLHAVIVVVDRQTRGWTSTN